MAKAGVQNRRAENDIVAEVCVVSHKYNYCMLVTQSDNLPVVTHLCQLKQRVNYWMH